MTRQEVFEKGEVINSDPYGCGGNLYGHEKLVHLDGKFYLIKQRLNDSIVRGKEQASPLNIVALEMDEIDLGFPCYHLELMRRWKKGG